MKKYIYLLVAALVFITFGSETLSAQDVVSGPIGPAVTTSAWGSDGVIITPSGKSAQITFGCAGAYIPKGWPVFGKRGKVKLRGTYTQSTGAPPSYNDMVLGSDPSSVTPKGPTAVPAKFKIRVRNDKMHLRMKVRGGDWQKFKLTRNYQGIIERCM